MKNKHYKRLMSICMIALLCITSLNTAAFAGTSEKSEWKITDNSDEKINVQCTDDSTYKRDSMSTFDASYDDYIDLSFSGTFDYDKAYEVLSLVNSERAKKGLPALTMDRDLLDQAMYRAAESAVYFDHTRPNGKSCFTILDGSYGYAGENIAYGYTTSKQVMNGWINSPGHYQNIIDSDFKSIGIGCFYQPDGNVFWTQLFTDNSKPSKATNIHKVTSNVTVEVLFDNSYVYADESNIKLAGGQKKTIEMYAKNIGANTSDLKLSPYTAIYVSDDDGIAHVDAYGEITGIKKGKTTVYAILDMNEDTITAIEIDVNVTSDGGSALTEDALRIYGRDRYDTSIEIGYMYQLISGAYELDSVIVADGSDYPDALSGAYLAKVKNAPILTVGKDEISQSKVRGYINSNLKTGGTVYILGGTGAVSEDFAKSLGNYKVERLGGKTRYDTNMAILKEAGVTNQDILICSGTGFADSLSASSVGKPIMLVDKSVSSQQKTYLNSISSRNYYVIGGTGAVNDTVVSEIKKHGKVERVWGDNRYATSAAVAQKFFGNCEAVTIAYGLNFPDGLAGGPLAMSFDAPLLLATSNDIKDAQAYVRKSGAVHAFILGGPALISDAAVNKIMG